MHTILKGITNKLYYGAHLKVNVKRVLGVPFAHGIADQVHSRPAGRSVKPGREEVPAEYRGQEHLVQHDGQIQGETADE